MKTYDDAFALWEDIQKGIMEAEPTVESGIWEVTEVKTSETGYVFCDETENFNPKFYPTIKDALQGRTRYCQTELGGTV